MANRTSSYKPLDPMASPYQKILSPHSYVYIFPHPPPPPYNHNLPPPLAFPSFSTYNIRCQPFIRTSFPLHLPSRPEKNSNFSLTPVPCGPRVPKSKLPARCRKIASVVRCRQWRPKVVENEPVVNVAAEKTKWRWKNRRGEYESFLPLEADSTSVMIKNIPNKYTRNLLIQTLDNHCKLENMKIKNGVSAYDFLYLPIDFNRRSNAGFAFANFTNPEAATRFRDAFNGKRWDLFDSPKIAEVYRARIQGKKALINHCKGMDFTYGSKEDMPVWFEPARNGSVRVSRMFTVGKSFLS